MIGAYVEWSPGRKNSPGWLIAENGCHLWIGAISHDGYGLIRGRTAHRVRYEREVGPVPEGLELDHFYCDNRVCCNPLHVRPVTHRENSLRGNTVGAFAAAKTHCVRGHSLIDKENLRKSNRGARVCGECSRAAIRAHYHRTKAARPG